MKLCLSQATTMTHSFADDIAGYADGGWPAVEVWMTKLEQHLKQHSVAETQALLATREIVFAAAAYQGGLLLSQGEARQSAFEQFRTRLELCQQFGIPTLILVADFAQTWDDTTLGRAIVSLTQAAQWASGYGVQLALEFRGTGTFCTNLATTLAIIENCQQPNLGVCLDWFHFYTGPSKLEDLAHLTKANLAHVQLCDVAGIPREMMTDADRIFPGEGDFHFTELMQHLRAIGYDKWLSLEMMNPIVWQAKPSQVADLGHTAMQNVVNKPNA